MRSRPAWARGLKQQYEKNIAAAKKSRPAWARGLKPKPPATIR